MAVVVFDFEDDLYIRVDGVLFLPGEIVACGKTEFEYSRIVLVRREKIGNSAVSAQPVFGILRPGGKTGEDGADNGKE